ncbi:MAG: hypothetical protein LBM75_10325 [Myxococcales bacterium]|nr:hypothetical protein [Myxococcales bacterium]
MTRSEMATTIATLAEQSFIVILDEFHTAIEPSSRRSRLIYREGARLSAKASSAYGGLFVRGSLYTEMPTLLKDRAAPSSAGRWTAWRSASSTSPPTSRFCALTLTSIGAACSCSGTSSKAS